MLFSFFFIAVLVSGTDFSEELNHQDDYVAEPLIHYQCDCKVYEDKEYLDNGVVKKNYKIYKICR